MTNPGDSDEWWKKYGGEGVSSESGGHATPPPESTPPPAGYGSTPGYPTQPPGTPPPQQQYPSCPQPPAQPYGQPGYGYPGGGQYQPYGYPAQRQGTNGLAVGSLIASILGLCTCVGAIVGIVLGIIALNQIKERGGEGRGMALAGIWIGVVAIVLSIIYVAARLVTTH
ncbi:DUF4190 domain-containing protein [Nocardia terpenica]|uniref:DUF4190 domain-containing protein n=1 Tax=Nocardia terpenica TaxID=455432 RepID=UPI00155978D6|nr:DUF4190 domain-containing protein [Nocardia terpenica]NQE88617.1 DUF4190 domain-containing protein [Nocardia terpenica]